MSGDRHILETPIACGVSFGVQCGVRRTSPPAHGVLAVPHVFAPSLQVPPAHGVLVVLHAFAPSLVPAQVPPAHSLDCAVQQG